MNNKTESDTRLLLDDLASTSLLARCIVAYSGETKTHISTQYNGRKKSQENGSSIAFPGRQLSSSESRHALLTPLSMIRIMTMRNQWHAEVARHKSGNDPLTSTQSRSGWKDERAMKLFFRSSNWTKCSAAYPTIPRCYKISNGNNGAGSEDEVKEQFRRTYSVPHATSQDADRINFLPHFGINKLDKALAEYSRATKSLLRQQGHHASRQSVMINQVLTNLPSRDETLKICISKESPNTQNSIDTVEPKPKNTPPQQEACTSEFNELGEKSILREVPRNSEAKTEILPLLRLITSSCDVKFKAATYEALLPLLTANPLSRPKKRKRRSTQITPKVSPIIDRSFKVPDPTRQQKRPKHEERDITLSANGFGGRALFALLRVVSAKYEFQ